MSIVTEASIEPGPPSVHEGTWRVGWRGVRTVAVLELRQRVRSTRWLVVLGLWVLLLAGLTVLLRRAVFSAVDSVSLGEGDGTTDLVHQELVHHYAGAALFGLVVFLVLGLGGLVAPALAATSVNGDRQAGVLAALQTTLLTPAEIALGKLLAAWTTSLALLAAALPFVLWAYLEGGTPAGRLLTTLVVLALSLLVVCAVALGWSAIASRTAASTVLTYLTVVFLGIGLPILFLVTLPLVSQQDQVRIGMYDTGACTVETMQVAQYHTERSWWLLAANPFVVVADSAPPIRESRLPGLDEPLTIIRDGVREARLGPAQDADPCGTNRAAQQAQEEQRRRDRDALPAAWPYGLAADLATGAVFTALAVRRLRAPARVLPRGTRVA
jgi:ABC-type transport system involved in multi-copper enzyme maturation permease subunit